MYESIVIIKFYDNKFCAIVFRRFLSEGSKDRCCNVSLQVFSTFRTRCFEFGGVYCILIGQIKIQITDSFIMVLNIFIESIFIITFTISNRSKQSTLRLADSQESCQESFLQTVLTAILNLIGFSFSKVTSISVHDSDVRITARYFPSFSVIQYSL